MHLGCQENNEPSSSTLFLKSYLEDKGVILLKESSPPPPINGDRSLAEPVRWKLIRWGHLSFYLVHPSLAMLRLKGVCLPQGAEDAAQEDHQG